MPDPAITDPSSDRLATVEVTTHEGDVYSFPAMDVKLLEGALRVKPEKSLPALALVNASYSVLSIPFRIVKTITAEGRTLWVSAV